MKVIYISYKDFSDLSSGSKVRPYRIYQTFIERGNHVILINGNFKKRLSLFFKFIKQRPMHVADYCYIEPSTYPTNPLDYLIFLYLRWKKVPMGYFYRDMYYKFPEFFSLKSANKYFLILRYKIDLILFKQLFKVVFFPSLLMADNFSFKTKIPLPPAGTIEFIDNNITTYSIIYVGGINSLLGSSILLEAMKKVNLEYKQINLNLVCRKEDVENIKEFKDESWLKISHISGDELYHIYRENDFAIIPRKKNPYFDFSMPVKLFEYMSYGMPIVSTNCTEMADFIEKNQIGIVVNDDAESLAKGIVYLYDNPRKLMKFRNNIKQSLTKGNLWEHRVEIIESSLLS